MGYVFLSYSRMDKGWMYAIRGEFIGKGIETWSDEGIEIGDRFWQSTIETAIKAAACMVVILTSNAKNSEWVNIEIGLAVSFNKPVFPFWVEGEKFTAIPPALTLTQWIDARSDYRSGVDKLINKILELSSVREQKAIESSPNSNKLDVFEYVKSVGVTHYFRELLTINRISAHIHKQAVLDPPDDLMETGLKTLNERRAKNKQAKFYGNPRYRIIRPPYHETAKKFSLEVGQADFTHFVLNTSKDVDVSIKNHIREIVQSNADQLPKELRSTDPDFNATNMGLLGIQMVLVTRDGYTLLRRRDDDHYEWPNAWDVSFSGYCGINSISPDDEDELDIWYTVMYEREREIGLLAADPRGIRFTGLHRSKETGTTVMLGYWRIEATRDDLARKLNKKFPKGATVFKTTEKADELYVWNNMNLVVEFDTSSIATALLKAEKEIRDEKNLSSKPPIVLPAARASLLLALAAQGKSTSDLLQAPWFSGQSETAS